MVGRGVMLPTMVSAIINVQKMTILVASLVGSAAAVEIPAESLSNLGSSQFHEREAAQLKLLDWGRNQPDAAMGEFLRQHRVASDPEVRLRCLLILRDLVADEYMKEGEGYMGIGLKDEISDVPGEPKPRNLIRVTMVQAGTPADRAGIQIGDLIAGVGGELWPEEVFRQKILMMKPNTKVDLGIVRNGVLISLQVILGRRPLSVGNGFFNGQNIDPEAAERAAKEAHFRRWLSQRKLQR